MNIVVLQGKLSRPPEARELPSGPLVVYDVTTRDDDGHALTAPVAWFGAPANAIDMIEGDEVMVVGTVRRRFFQVGGSTQSRTEVVADLVAPKRRKAKIRAAIERVRNALDGFDP
jgi:single-stranded DNA-binding protein